MNARIVFAAITIALLLQCHVALSAEENAGTSELWGSIQDRQNPRLGDGFEVLDNFPVVVQGKGLSAKGTALAAILSYQFGADDAKDKMISFFFRSQMLAANEMLAKLADDSKNKSKAKGQEAKLWEYLKRELSESGRKIEVARKRVEQNNAEWKTPSVRNACLLDVYLQETKQDKAVLAVEAFAKDRLLLVTTQTFEKVSWEPLKEAIDKGVPVLVTHKAESCVVVGYVIRNDSKHALLYRPSLAKYCEGSLKDFISQADKESKVSWIKNAVKSMEKIVTDEDFFLETRTALPPGIEFLSLVDFGDSEMTCFYGWKADLDKHYPRLVAYIGSALQKEGDGK